MQPVYRVRLDKRVQMYILFKCCGSDVKRLAVFRKRKPAFRALWALRG